MDVYQDVQKPLIEKKKKSLWVLKNSMAFKVFSSMCQESYWPEMPLQTSLQRNGDSISIGIQLCVKRTKTVPWKNYCLQTMQFLSHEGIDLVDKLYPQIQSQSLSKKV